MADRLGKLPEGWAWFMRDGHHAAGLLTHEYDSWVDFRPDEHGGTVILSQGLAPVEVVLAVIEVNRT